MTVFKKSVNIPPTASTEASIGNFPNGFPNPTPKLLLNGPLVLPNGQVSFISMGYSSTVSINSTRNMSTYRFTVAGFSNGVLINETIVGPNANTVYTNTLFDSIISISPSSYPAAQSFTVGSGSSIAIVLQNANNLADNGQPNSVYNVFVNVPQAVFGLDEGQLNIYGVGGKSVIGPLTNTSLNYDTRNNNYIPIPTTGADQTDYTVEQLTNGFNVKTESPFGAVIVYLTTLILPSVPVVAPVFIEVSQG